jgi:hypothetical protein
LCGSEQLGPNGLSGAGHKRRRHETNDIGNTTNGSSGEAEKTKKGETGDDKANDTIVQRKESNGSGNGGAGDSSDMTAAMAVLAVQGRTRRLAEAGRRGF